MPNADPARIESASVYHLLSRVFRAEPDAATLQKLRAVRFPERGAGWLAAGARFSRAVAALPRDAEETLAADYARAFLGAGSANGEAAFPYASVYTSEPRSVMQEAFSRMQALLSDRGLAVPSGHAGLLADHLAVELDFAAWLCEHASAQETRDYLNDYMLDWVPAWAADVGKYAETEFYRAAAALAEAFLLDDCAALCRTAAAPAQADSGTHID